jgi:hypothetical protein
LKADVDENLLSVQSDDSLALWRESCDDSGIIGGPLESPRDAMDRLFASCLPVVSPARLMVDSGYMIPFG